MNDNLHQLLFATAAALTLATSACDLDNKNIGETGETDTGDGDGDGDGGDGDGDNNNGACGEETLSVITELDSPPSSFDATVNDFLAQAEGDYSGEFSWMGNDGPSMVAHAGTSSPLAMSVTYAGGEVRLTEVEFAGQFPNGQAGGSPCSNRLEIDVTLDFVTMDGLFAESLTVALQVYSHGFEEGPEGPGIYHSLDMSAHMGDLALDDFSFTGATVEDLILIASFGPATVDGTLLMEVLSEDMGWVGAGGVASFNALSDAANSPCGECGPDEYCHETFFEGQHDLICLAVPAECIEDQVCDCIGPVACTDGALESCTDGDVVSLICELG